MRTLRHDRSSPLWASVFTASLVVSLISAAPAQDPLPDAREVIDRYVEALGGKEALTRHPGRHAVGRMEIPSQGIAADIDMYSAPPNKMRSNIELSGIGSIRVGFDGEIGWTVNPAMGPMVLDGRTLDQMREQADWQAALHPETFVASVETVEKTEFEGHTCYKVRVVTRWDEEYFEYFDVDSGLLVGNERTQASPMGDVPTVTVISDYREFDGLLVPMKSVQRMMGVEQIITMNEMEVLDVDESVFDLPPEIQALIEEGAEQSGSPL
jgi:hypothetical protein